MQIAPEIRLDKISLSHRLSGPLIGYRRQPGSIIERSIVSELSELLHRGDADSSAQLSPDSQKAETPYRSIISELHLCERTFEHRSTYKPIAPLQQLSIITSRTPFSSTNSLIVSSTPHTHHANSNTRTPLQSGLLQQPHRRTLPLLSSHPNSNQFN